LSAALDTRWRGYGLGDGVSLGGLERSAGPSLARQRHAHGALAVRLDGGEQDLAYAAVQIALVDALADFLVSRRQLATSSTVASTGSKSGGRGRYL